MSDQTTDSADESATDDAPATPTLEELQSKIEELTGHSRKWEDRAKANKDKADELDALKTQSMTDSEKAQAALDEVTRRVTEAEERASASEAALLRYSIAAEYELSKEDIEALASVSDEATLRALAERLAGRSPSGPMPNPAQGRVNTMKPTHGQAFADALSDLF